MNSSDVVLHDVKRKTKSPEEGTAIHEEFAIKGDKGLTIKYYRKDNNHNEKVVIFAKDGNYVVRTTKDGQTDEKVLSKDQLLDLLSKDERLNFAVDIVNKDIGTQQSRSPFANQMRGQKRGSLHGQKRGSLHGQKRGSLRGSLRGSMNQGSMNRGSMKRGSMKRGSKRGSMGRSVGGSRYGSRRGSRSGRRLSKSGRYGSRRLLYGSRY